MPAKAAHEPTEIFASVLSFMTRVLPVEAVVPQVVSLPNRKTLYDKSPFGYRVYPGVSPPGTAISTVLCYDQGDAFFVSHEGANVPQDEATRVPWFRDLLYSELRSDL